jgi:hypothetical protein
MLQCDPPRVLLRGAVWRRSRWFPARALLGLSVRLARALNRVMDRRGAVFADRYHVQLLAGPAQVRWALRYVICNARKHAAQRGERYPAAWLDPFSSARFFDGWCDARSADPPDGSVARPLGWLLTTGWRKSGLLGAEEVPGSKGATR